MNQVEHLSTMEAAQELGVSYRTLQLWVKQGKFPHAYKLDPDALNSPYRIPRTDIEAILNKRKTGPLDPATVEGKPSDDPNPQNN